MNEQYAAQAKDFVKVAHDLVYEWEADGNGNNHNVLEDIIAAALAAAAQEALEQAAQKFDKSKHSLWKGYLIAEELRALKVQP